ncbi:MAG: transcription elongation factor GreA [Candidatus Gracilibacteria bacterium]|nr:transcription elongation factor GreA [Candidatus Gracilibacteria bacterium]MDD2908908.1 transcription elongation factor GreA [Candidatus Gracilibacteria bacterium]
MISKKILLTKEGLLELQQELFYLKDTKRVEVADKLKEAISYGDLSENSEYEDARNEQAQLELRVQDIEDILKNYELVDNKEGGKKEKRVNIGSSVVIKHTSDAHKGEKETYKIVGTTESDIYENKISNESPMGKAILGSSVGQIVSVKSPAGVFEYEILEIK